MKGTGSAKQGYRRGGFWDELDRIPDSNNQLGPTIAYVGKD